MELGFEKPTHAQWLEKIKKDLKGQKNVEDLDYSTENLRFNNFEDISKNETFEPLVQQHPKSCVMCAGKNSHEKNVLALAFLELGVEALGFEIGAEDDVQVLFKDIYLDMIDVLCFYDEDSTLEKFQNSSTHNSNHNIIFIRKNQKLEHVTLSENKSFEERIKTFKSLVGQEDCTSLFVRLSLKNEFLPQIAELRAYNRIWSQTKKSGDLIIAAEMPFLSVEDSEVHPLIIYNYLNMSARMGMANYIIHPPFESVDELARLTLNINHILTEESRFSVVSDPIAGAYIIEQMTETIVRL